VKAIDWKALAWTIRESILEILSKKNNLDRVYRTR
jgi:hypothetical protein